MKGLGIALAVGGWMLAVSGLLATEATAVRMGAALVGFAVSLAGIATVNGAHLETVFWKGRGH